MEEYKNVPRIRFPEFTEPWEQRKLSEVTEEFQSGKFIAAVDIENAGEYPVYGGNGLRGYCNKYNHDGDFALIGRQGALCGNMNYSCGKAYFTEHAVAVKANASSNTKFLYYLLGKMNLGQYSDQSAQPGLAVGKLIKLENMLPSKSEQDAIAGFLTRLDETITLQQRKIDEMKEYKKGMLQKMFPKDGERVPEIRVPGFTGNWEQRKLSDEFVDFIVPMRDKPKEFGGTIPWTRIEDIEGKYLHGTLSGQYVTEETVRKMNLKIIPKDSLIVSSSATFGVVAVVTEDLITNQTFIGLVPKDKDIVDYWYSYFQSDEARRYMKLQSAGSTIFYIARESFENMPIKTPSKEEALKIGNFLAKLDALITLQQRKIDEMKEYKKGLLQQMFV